MVTADTNIAFYALQQSDKTGLAEAAIAKSDFLSVQVLNEYAFASRRKLKRDWDRIGHDIELLQNWVQKICAIEREDTSRALALCKKYKLSFFDALIIAVALNNGATKLYSEDMQHGFIVDNTLTIIDPFLEAL